MRGRNADKACYMGRLVGRPNLVNSHDRDWPCFEAYREEAYNKNPPPALPGDVILAAIPPYRQPLANGQCCFRRTSVSGAIASVTQYDV